MSPVPDFVDVLNDSSPTINTDADTPTTVYEVPSGMPISVFNDRYSRVVNGKHQLYKQRAEEMARGNCALDPSLTEEEIEEFVAYAKAGITPLSGRHLQNGDATQPTKNMEVFTNCSTTAFSFMNFYLLLNGSGVGRDYSTESCRVDWDFLPNIRIVLDGGSDDDGDVDKGAHPDWKTAYSEFQSCFDSLREAKHKYDTESEDVRWIRVRDSREGWAEVIATLETAAYHRNHKDSLFIFDFSGIRPLGSPIKGMQNRQAQGPIPLMRAVSKMLTIKGARMRPWKQALFIDHYLAAVVVMGMVRRCLPKSTLIHLERGLVPIQDVHIGDRVLTADGYRNVTDNIVQGQQEVVTIVTSMGTFKCTGNHRVAVLTNSGDYTWKFAAALTIADRMVFVDDVIPGTQTFIPCRTPYGKSDIVLTPEIAWLLGVLGGYGTSTSTNAVHINVLEDELAIRNKITSALTALGHYDFYYTSGLGGFGTITVHSIEFKRMVLDYYQLHHTHAVPDCVLNGPITCRAAYLAGIFDSASDNNSISIATYRKAQVGKHIQALYSSLGIPTQVVQRMVDTEWANIGLLDEFSTQRFVDVIQPHIAHKTVIVGTDDNGAACARIPFNDCVYDTHSATFVQDCAVMCADKVGQLVPIAVKDVILTGELATTYDLSVEGRNEFVAEGMLVHNSARMATKAWTDRDVFEFIDIKRGGHLWSANDSILVDEEFWEQAADPRPSHGRRVYEAAIGAAYYDETGEPGFINTHLLKSNDNGMEDINADSYINQNIDIDLHPKTYEMIDKILTTIKKSKYKYITNPCGEIVIAKYGAYCVIGDVVLAHAKSKQQARRAVYHTAKALVRVNTMQAIYQTEVLRTNRIGVGITGIFEYAYNLFGLRFYDLISAYEYTFNGGEAPPNPRVMEFWHHMRELGEVAEQAANEYSDELCMVHPHTYLTMKPSGTISKVMNCTEAAHLPPYRFYTRWVICAKDSKEHVDYVNRGYPIKDVSHQYHGCVVVGFPTKHSIVDVMGADKVVTADEVNIQQQFEWIKLLEQWWFGADSNNQVSYTLKYDNKIVTHDDYFKTVLKWQPQVKCCSMMPFTDVSAYAYLPEEIITEEKYHELMEHIVPIAEEAYSDEELECEGGACPIELRLR